jgi:predicted nicotinamide N-methyase
MDSGFDLPFNIFNPESESVLYSDRVFSHTIHHSTTTGTPMATETRGCKVMTLG